MTRTEIIYRKAALFDSIVSNIPPDIHFEGRVLRRGNGNPLSRDDLSTMAETVIRAIDSIDAHKQEQPF